MLGLLFTAAGLAVVSRTGTELEYGWFALGLVAFGFLGMGPVTIAVDSYGPVTDNAQSVYELSRIETARGIENLKRQWGVHAAGPRPWCAPPRG